MRIRLGLDENVFSQSAYNSTDVHTSVSFLKKNPRWSFSLEKGLDYDTTRTSEITGAGTSPIVSRHLGLFFTPQVTFSPSSATSLSLRGSFLSSRYKKKDDFTSYETYALSPSVEYRFTPIHTGFVSLEAQRYRTLRDGAARSDTLSGSLGWKAAFSERLQAEASAGLLARRQYAYGHPVSSWALNGIFSGRLTFTSERDTLLFEASRAQAPYADGTEALQTSLSLAEDCKITPRVSLQLKALYLSSDYQIKRMGQTKSLADGKVGLTYRLADNLDGTAFYRYRHKTFIKQTSSAEDHAFFLGLSFHLDPYQF